jgi:cytochrome c5
MSDVQIEEHSSPIKTPKQLIIVVLLAFLIPITLIVMLSQLVTTGIDAGKDNPALTDAAIAQRLKPVGQVEVIDPSAPRVEKSGKDIVEAVCGACHTAGLLSAPKIGDKAAWGKLIREGHDSLTKAAIEGIRQMPARGGNPDLSDVEIGRAIAYMANQAGANFKEPEAKPAPAAESATVPAATPTSTAATQTVAVPAPVAPAAAVVAPDKADPNKGKGIYESACIVCHGAGVAGAPKAGDKTAWAPRLKTGMNALYASALKGKGAMPPKGGNQSLGDADVKAAVDYLAGMAK